MTDRQLESVEPTALTCEQVDERDLAAGYIAGRLADADAVAYEAHVFGCERCWSRLQTALAVAGAAPRGGRARARQRLWPSLAAAATLVAIAGAGWWLAGRGAASPEALRGPVDSFVIQPQATPAGVTVTFGRLAGADRYRVRVFSEAGVLLAQREVPDTIVPVGLEPAAAGGTPVLIQVTALDALSDPLASSGLVRVDRPLPPR